MPVPLLPLRVLQAAGGGGLSQGAADLRYLPIVDPETTGALQAWDSPKAGTNYVELGHNGTNGYLNSLAGKLYMQLAGVGIWEFSASYNNPLKEIRINGHGIRALGAGCRIGMATTDSIGFWNQTPVPQPAHIADPTDLASCITAITAINAMLATTGLTASS